MDALGAKCMADRRGGRLGVGHPIVWLGCPQAVGSPRVEVSRPDLPGHH